MGLITQLAAEVVRVRRTDRKTPVVLAVLIRIEGLPARVNDLRYRRAAGGARRPQKASKTNFREKKTPRAMNSQPVVIRAHHSTLARML